MSTQPTQRFSMKCQNGEEAQSFLSSIYVPLRLETKNRQSVDFETLAMHYGGLGFSTSTSHSGIRLAFDEPFDGYGMSIPLFGSLSVGTGAKELIRSRTNGGLMMDSSTVISAVFSPHSVWQRITLSTEELHHHLAFLTERQVHHRLRFTPHFQTDCGAASLILAITQALSKGTQGDAPLLSAPTAMASLKEALLALFIEGMPHSHSESLGRRAALPAPRQVRRAIEFMHAHLLQPLRLEDIAQASQTSARSLQLAFRQFRGTTPMEYLRGVRLDGAHSELLQGVPGTTVADVAYRWGFSHHGMFASRYAARFGEPPSATLRNHRKD